MSNTSSHWINNISGVIPAADSISKNKVNPKLHILDIIFDIVSPSSVVEMGCGKAGWLAAARKLGAKEIVGYDIPEIDISERQIRPEEFIPADLSQKIAFEKRYDLAISTEVAEHIPAKKAFNFIENLTLAAPVVLFSASPPYQGGLGHTNENWVEYWNQMFQKLNFQCFDFIRDKVWHKSEIPYYYRQNILVFCEESIAHTFKKHGYSASEDPKSIIHPEMLIKAVHRRRGVISDRFNIMKDVSQYYSNINGYSHLEKINCNYGDDCYRNN